MGRNCLGLFLPAPWFPMRRQRRADSRQKRTLDVRWYVCVMVMMMMIHMSMYVAVIYSFRSPASNEVS